MNAYTWLFCKTSGLDIDLFANIAKGLWLEKHVEYLRETKVLFGRHFFMKIRKDGKQSTRGR